MTIEELREEKRKLHRAVIQAMDQFTNNTDMPITEITGCTDLNDGNEWENEVEITVNLW